jgi:hypothetical protein
MTDNRMSGLALLAASAGLILTLSLHPSGRITPAQVDQMVRKLVAVHSLGLATLPIMFLGALGLARVLASPNRLGIVGLVLYGFAVAAMLCGVVADGLVTPSLLREMVAASPGTNMSDAWRVIFKYNDYLDVALVQVSMVASAAAIAVWSVAIVRSATLPRGVGVYGLILGLIAVLAVFSGTLKAEHVIHIVVVSQCSWFLIVGVLLWRLQEPVSQQA